MLKLYWAGCNTHTHTHTHAHTHTHTHTHRHTHTHTNTQTHTHTLLTDWFVGLTLTDKVFVLVAEDVIVDVVLLWSLRS